MPSDEPSTCVFVFFAADLSRFDGLEFPGGRTRQENVARMASAIFEENGSARLVGQRKWQAKQRSEQHGGLLFAAGPSPAPPIVPRPVQLRRRSTVHHYS